MDTSNSSDFRPIDLLNSAHQEDIELYKRTIDIVEKIVGELKPVLKYVSGPIEFCGKDGTTKACEVKNTIRALYICDVDKEFVGKGNVFEGDYLFLNEAGNFFVARNMHGNHYWYHVGGGWQYLSFEKLIQSLRGVLQVAISRREAHLATIKVRSEKLDKIVEILKS